MSMLRSEWNARNGTHLVSRKQCEKHCRHAARSRQPEIVAWPVSTICYGKIARSQWIDPETCENHHLARLNLWSIWMMWRLQRNGCLRTWKSLKKQKGELSFMSSPPTPNTTKVDRGRIELSFGASHPPLVPLFLGAGIVQCFSNNIWIIFTRSKCTFPSNIPVYPSQSIINRSWDTVRHKFTMVRTLQTEPDRPRASSLM